ncbi:hypothetical protein ACN0IV_16595 [Trabulsiella odontotermitis]|uniref:hypothetical protein n=1 Tax=Trabulsiella odontotermitis TaxID=379893 RepID=UPI003AD03C42
MTIELYEGRYSPLTSEIGYLQCDVDVAVNVYSQWMKKIQALRGVDVITTPFSSDSLHIALLKLLPLTSIERRRVLFIPVEKGWSAYFDNGWRGADAGSVISYLSRTIGCKGVRSCYIPNLSNRLGAVIMEIYSATNTEFINTLRSVSAINDGRKWLFSAAGKIQPFEYVDKYKATKIKDRFTESMLKDYLMYLGIHAFDNDCYYSSKYFLVEKKGPMAVSAKEYNLDEVQKSWL